MTDYLAEAKRAYENAKHLIHDADGPAVLLHFVGAACDLHNATQNDLLLKAQLELVAMQREMVGNSGSITALYEESMSKLGLATPTAREVVDPEAQRDPNEEAHHG